MKKSIYLKMIMALVCLGWSIQGYADLVPNVTNVAEVVEGQALNDAGYAPVAYASSPVGNFENISAPLYDTGGRAGWQWQPAWSVETDRDNAWWYVDLGTAYCLTRININWDDAGAYPTKLQFFGALEVDDDSNPIWNSISSVIEYDTYPSEQSYTIAANVRYIKVEVLGGNSNYGPRMRNFRAYASSFYIPVDNPELTSVTLSPVEMIEGEEAIVAVAAFNQGGAAYTDCSFQFEVNDLEGAVIEQKADGLFYAKGLKAGEYTFKVTATDNLNTSNIKSSEWVSLTVKEARKLVSFSIAFKENYKITNGAESNPVLVSVGYPIELNISNFKDQYNAVYNVDASSIIWELTNGEVINQKFTASALGNGTITAKVGDVASNSLNINAVADGINLALSGIATASTDYDKATTDNFSGFASMIDGNNNTHTTFPEPTKDADDKDLVDYNVDFVVELVKLSTVDLIEISWQGARSRDFEILFAGEDGNYAAAEYSFTSDGGVAEWTTQFDISSVANVKYVKISSSKAASQYGVKVREIRIFGKPSSANLAIDEDNSEGTNLVLTGTWDDIDFASIDNASITSYDLTNVTNLPDAISALNRNCVFFVATDANETLRGKNNVVVDGIAKVLHVRDGYSFNVNRQFNALIARYTRSYKGMQNGWASIVLPFNMPDNDNNYMDWFVVEELSACNGTYVSFTETRLIEAYKPYIMKVSDNAANADEVTISVENVNGIEVNPTPTESLSSESKDGYKLVGTLSQISAENKNILRNDGSEFVIGGTGSTIPAFRAYLALEDGSSFSKQLSVLHDGETTGMDKDQLIDELYFSSSNGTLEVFSSKAQIVNVYALDGRIITTLELNEGINSFAGFAKGIYVISNQKVVIK